MSGFELAFEWDDAKVQSFVVKAIRHGKDMKPVMADFSEYMMTETLEHFEKEEDPQGQGWQKLKPVTKALRARKKKWPGQILQVDALLKNSIHPAYRSHDMSLSSNQPHAAIHNFGGKAGRGEKVTIPKRQYLGFNADDIDYLEESIKGWMITGKVGG